MPFVNLSWSEELKKTDIKLQKLVTVEVAGYSSTRYLVITYNPEDTFFGLTILQGEKALQKSWEYETLIFSKAKMRSIVAQMYNWICSGQPGSKKAYVECTCHSEALRIWYTWDALSNDRPSIDLDIFTSYVPEWKKGIVADIELDSKAVNQIFQELKDVLEL